MWALSKLDINTSFNTVTSFYMFTHLYLKTFIEILFPFGSSKQTQSVSRGKLLIEHPGQTSLLCADENKWRFQTQYGFKLVSVW